MSRARFALPVGLTPVGAAAAASAAAPEAIRKPIRPERGQAGHRPAAPSEVHHHPQSAVSAEAMALPAPGELRPLARALLAAAAGPSRPPAGPHRPATRMATADIKAVAAGVNDDTGAGRDVLMRRCEAATHAGPSASRRRLGPVRPVGLSWRRAGRCETRRSRSPNGCGC
jgi:hypothetical protein